MANSFFYGMNVVSHPLAEKSERVAVITRNPTAKRRRRWRLTYEQKRTPCAFVVGNTVYMHPDALAALKANTKEAP